MCTRSVGHSGVKPAGFVAGTVCWWLVTITITQASVISLRWFELEHFQETKRIHHGMMFHLHTGLITAITLLLCHQLVKKAKSPLVVWWDHLHSLYNKEHLLTQALLITMPSTLIPQSDISFLQEAQLLRDRVELSLLQQTTEVLSVWIWINLY